MSVHGSAAAGEPRPVPRRSWARWAFAAVFIVAALLQVQLAVRPGIWVDEVFSLAMATGHSLEQPAAATRPALGDYFDHAAPGPPAALLAYATHGRPAASLGGVLRAVFLSDTSPPLYYVLLSGWTRLAGTSDAALRLFSTACALACLPLLWVTGRQLGGRATGLVAAALFAFSPPVLYYAAEGRMYALTWVFGLALAALAFRAAADGARWPTLVAWAAVGALGLLTHYFFAFVWAAIAAWLWLHAGRGGRARVAMAAVLTGLLVLPWYLRLPASLRLWRVTAGWLDGDLTLRQLVTAPALLAKYMVFWGASYRDKGEVLATVLFVGLVIAMLRRGVRPWVTGRPQLLWLWVIAAAVGPVAFDLLLHSTSSQVWRYGIAGLPGAVLLIAVGSGALPGAARAAFVALFAAAAWPGAREEVLSEPPRRWHPFPQIAARVDAWHRAAPVPAADLVLVHSIPSGSIALARYLHSTPDVAPWTIRVGWRRTPADLDRLLAGRCRVALVKVHDLGDPAPAEPWLRARGTLVGTERFDGGGTVLYFTLAGAPRRPSTTQPSSCATGA